MSLIKLTPAFPKLVVAGIEHLFAQNDRSVIKRLTDTTSTVTGKINITSGQRVLRVGIRVLRLLPLVRRVLRVIRCNMTTTSCEE